ncbi:YicC/YloC family endoribonuclease [Proteiniborus sp. MB09-C3]|uniref:YicC/YloC family endoribonuclease n=1 Tax=Proteiniborus sp. MB09-C3 TaxID=3050072 RepID=UPI003324BBAE
MRSLIKSMTGFGRGEMNDGLRNFTVEIKSVNHRYNDTLVKMPKHIGYLEENVKKKIRNVISRGRVEAYISLEYVGEGDVEVNVDLPLARSYKKAIDLLCEEIGLKNEVSVELFAKFPDILKTSKREEDEDEIWLCLSRAVDIALKSLIAMRIEEGKELSKNIKSKLLNIREIVKQIENRAPLIVIEYKEKLCNRIKELLDEKYEIDESKLANEVAFYADKSSIDEEIVRLYSHINQFIDILESDEDSVGRKLDFLVQEMNREVNTIGSKVGDIIITNYVVELKSEMEKVREQIQNIE